MSNNLNQGASIEAERAYKSWQNEQPNRCWVAPWHMLTDTQRAEWVAEIEAARRTPADAVGAVNVKTWQERMDAEGLYAEGERLYGGWTAVTMARDAEIADLRAQLAAKGQGNVKFDLTDYSQAVNYANGTSTVVIAPASAQPADPSNAEFLAKRLSRVAKLTGAHIPKHFTHEQIAEVAGTILGDIARLLERGAQPGQRESAALKSFVDRRYGKPVAGGQDSANNGAEGEKNAN
jgi:hypothetical protein